ncbi:MAG: hypothetical protein IT261_01525 [Saprospiraceae bacterium]|nr:hypothetical protein [Saprospiraceae bacterium]
MKKYSLVIALVLCVHAIFAQIRVGLTGGANYTSWTWKVDHLPGGAFQNDPAFGWRAGVLAEIPLKKQLSLRAEFGTQVNANKKRVDYVFPSDILSGDLEGTPYIYRENYQFWEGSILAEVKPFRKASWLYFVAGATGGRLTKAWTSFKPLEPEKEHLEGGQILIDNNDWHHNQFSADLGLGGNIPLSKAFTLKLESRVQYHFSELDDLDNLHTRLFPIQLNLACVYQL